MRFVAPAVAAARRIQVVAAVDNQNLDFAVVDDIVAVGVVVVAVGKDCNLSLVAAIHQVFDPDKQLAAGQTASTGMSNPPCFAVR